MSDLRGSYARILAAPRPLRWILLGGALGLVALFSSLPVGGGSSMPDGVSFLLNWGHQFLYGAVAIALALASGLQPERLRGRALAAVLLLVGVTGYLDEWNQGRGGLRDSSLWDLISDLLGALLALTAARWTARAGRPVLEFGEVLFCLGLSLAWNCVPAYLPSPPLPTPLP